MSSEEENRVAAMLALGLLLWAYVYLKLGKAISPEVSEEANELSDKLDRMLARARLSLSRTHRAADPRSILDHLLARCLKGESGEAALSDLEELFDRDVVERGLRRARHRYTRCLAALVFARAVESAGRLSNVWARR